MLFSIVIPTRNRAHLLRKTLESVAAQDDPSWECIVVDDGGNDATEEVVRGMNDPRFRYLWKEHGERGAARNHGARNARGDYVYFLDSDDLLATFHLSDARRVLDRAERPPLLHPRFTLVDENGKVIAPQKYPRDVPRALLRHNLVGSYFFVRKDIALSHPFVEDLRFSIGEDWLHVLGLVANFPMLISDRHTVYIVQHGGRSMSWGGDRLLAACSVLVKHAQSETSLRRLGERRRRRVVRTMGAELRSLAGLAFIIEGRLKQGLLTYGEAVREMPELVFERRTAAVLLRAAKSVAKRRWLSGSAA